MAFVIAEPCIGTKDTACVDACPVNCIHPRKDEAGFTQAPQLYIHTDDCISCDLCLPVCPVAAIFEEEDLPSQWRHFAQVNADE
jgi:NAD-dependent dihydropyrimidine dehydrogenase PreA subunit